MKVRTVWVSLLPPGARPGEQVLQDQEGASQDPHHGVWSELWMGTLGSDAVNKKALAILLSLHVVLLFNGIKLQLKKLQQLYKYYICQFFYFTD